MDYKLIKLPNPIPLLPYNDGFRITYGYYEYVGQYIKIDFLDVIYDHSFKITNIKIKNLDDNIILFLSEYVDKCVTHKIKFCYSVDIDDKIKYIVWCNKIIKKINNKWIIE